MTAPIFISCLALLFTVGSFYWIQVRKGRLKLFPVITFSGYWKKSRLVLRLPVVLFNSGARPRVITALRLTTTDNDGETIILECHSFRRTVDPTADDMEDMAHAYAIPARQVVTKHAHFAVDSLPVFYQPGPTPFQVQALVDASTNWRKLGDVAVHVEIMHTPSYITYSNNPGVWPASLQDDAARYRARIFGTDALPLDAPGKPVH
ncbi:hypothetical protein J2S98_002515 [Arthrobacter oryzae]|uniref:hypothetical protein n=1 Tax=Arthrobacter oryzae TaxID=409290 RepID=UPI002788A3AB|nr:hypothetical protein [Arthrobacter oryzae]MDP9987348.1 hypothetical protein [Arthrobacter oryzae]